MRAFQYAGQEVMIAHAPMNKNLSIQDPRKEEGSTGFTVMRHRNDVADL